MRAMAARFPARVTCAAAGGMLAHASRCSGGAAADAPRAPESTRPSQVSDDPELNAEIMERWRRHIQEARESFRRLDTQSAERELQQALEDAAHFGHSSPPMATSLLNLAQLYRRAGRLEEAEPLLVRATGVLETTAGPHNKVTLLAMMDLANTQLERGDAAAAAARFGDVLARLEVAEEKQSAGKAALRAVRAGCLLQAAKADALLGQSERAEARLRLALELGEERWGAASGRLAVPYTELAQLMLAAGRIEEARAMCDRAAAVTDKPQAAARIEEIRLRLQRAGA